MDIKGTKMHLFFNLFWNLIKDYYFLDDSEDVGERFQADVEALCAQFKEDAKLHFLAKECCVAYATYLDMAYREKNGGSNG